MILWHSDFGADRQGLLNGAGSYAYLPFDCTLGAVAAVLNSGAPVGGSYVLTQNGSPISDTRSLTQGRCIVAPAPSTPLTLPGVTMGNVATSGKLSIDRTITGAPTTVPPTIVRYGIELLPVDPAMFGVEVWSVYATGETGFAYGGLFSTTFAGANQTWAAGVPGFANGYPIFGGAGAVPIFNSDVSDSEDADTHLASAYAAGSATPLARGGTFFNLMAISADGGGWDSTYTFSLRKNGVDALSVACSGATRIFTDTSAVHYEAGQFWNWKAVATGGSMAKGHLIVCFRPDSGLSSDGPGFGATGFGAQGF